MCFALYIGTQEKQLIGNWIQGETNFYFEELSKDEEIVKQKFTKPYIYYVGADTGCSCGFAYDSVDFNNPEEQESKKSPLKLIEFINLRTKVEELEVYCCWEGDCEEPIDEKIEIDISTISLESNYFSLVERRFILFTRHN